MARQGEERSDVSTHVGVAERLRRGYVFAQDCPSRDVLSHITSRWAVLVLVALMAGTHRFSALRRKVSGVSEKMLAQTLQTLEADGFVDRVAYPVVPPKVEYRLTPMGDAVAARLEGLADWVEIHIGDIVAHRTGHDQATRVVAPITAATETVQAVDAL